MPPPGQLQLYTSLSVSVLGSSSSGNATLIRTSDSAVLIDCGFGPFYISKKLRHLGLDFNDLDGVFITHIHGDHVNNWTLGKLALEGVPLYLPSSIERYLKRKFSSAGILSHKNLLWPMKKPEVRLNELLISHFDVPHDSEGGCYGYTIMSDGGGVRKKVTVTTDLARPTTSAVRHMADSDALIIESNYDVEMLENSRRPEWLKRRIREDAHLSNDQCANTVLQILDQSSSLPSNIALAHVSRECNTNRIAVACTSEALDRQGVKNVRIVETHPERTSEVIDV